MNIKSMFAGLVIAMTASLGTYFFYPPVKNVQAQSNCIDKDVMEEQHRMILGEIFMNRKFLIGLTNKLL